MTAAEQLFNEIATRIPNVKLGKMFGALCIKTPNGKAAAMLYNDEIVVKLDDVLKEKTLSQKGVKLFEPMPGRPMKDWVQIPYTYRDEWKDLAVISAYTAAQLKEKNKK